MTVPDRADLQETSLIMFKSFFAIVFVAWLSACAPITQEAGSIQRSVAITESELQTSDGKNLPVHKWAALDEENAIIIAVHGFNDYRNAFAFPASWWMQHGVTTYAYDQRGFGETDQVGVWASKELLKKDLASFVQVIRRKSPNVPIFLLGESMGGAVVMTAVSDPEFPEVDGVILSAPAVWGWQSLNIFYKSTLWISAHLFPGAKPSGKGLGIQASDNIPMLQNLGKDPLFIKQTRIDSIYGLVGLMDDAYDSAEKMTMPALFLYGANDEVIPKKPVEEVVSRLPKSADVVLYQDGWHLLMRDLQAAVVWNDILSWIERKEVPSGNKISALPLFPHTGQNISISRGRSSLK